MNQRTLVALAFALISACAGYTGGQTVGGPPDGVGLTDSGLTHTIPWQWLAAPAIGTLLGGLLLWRWGREEYA